MRPIIGSGYIALATVAISWSPTVTPYISMLNAMTSPRPDSASILNAFTVSSLRKNFVIAVFLLCWRCWTILM